jgi:hypothetical protein
MDGPPAEANAGSGNADEDDSSADADADADATTDPEDDADTGLKDDVHKPEKSEKEDVQESSERVEEEAERDDEDCIDLAAKERKSSDPVGLFTTGLGFSSDNEHRLRTVIKPVASKKRFSNTWCPDPSVCFSMFNACCLSQRFATITSIKLQG